MSIESVDVSVYQITSVHDVAGVNEAMARACRNLGRAGLVACAISAVDTACWALRG